MCNLFLGMDGGQWSMLVLLDILVSFAHIDQNPFEQCQGPSKSGWFHSRLLDRLQGQYFPLPFAFYSAHTSLKH